MKTVLMICLAIFQLSMTHGRQTYGKETIDKVDVNGFVKLEGTHVSESLQVNGRLKAEDAQIGEMLVNGTATLNRCTVKEMRVNGRAVLDHSTIKQKSVVCGTLQPSFSNFQDEITISSEKVIFNSCVLKSLRILKDKDDHLVQVVELKGKTTVDGSIIFESGKGEVIISSDSIITGAIVGGKIRK